MKPATAVFVILVLACVAGLAAAAEKMEVDFAFGWEGCYRPQRWMPLDLTIYPRVSKPLAGALSVTVEQDELTKMRVVYPIVLTPGLTLYAPLVAKMTFGVDELNAAIVNDQGKTCWKQKYELFAMRNQRGLPVTAVGGEDVLIGFTGKITSSLRRLGEHADSSNLGAGSGQVHVAYKPIQLLPIDWTGYDALDMLILNDPDWDRISPDQAKAIVDWVGQGGRMMIVLGAKALPAGHPIAGLLPFAPTPPRPVSLDPALLAGWKCLSPKTTTVQSWLPADLGDNRLWNVDAGGSIFAHGLVGFGKVGVLGFSPAVLEDGNPKNLAGLWAHQINQLLGRPSISLHEGPTKPSAYGRSSYYYQLGPGSDSTNRVLEHLVDIPQLQPLSIWVIIVLLAGLMVLVGPVDYFVLKRLDRQPMTWATTMVCVVLCSAAAYYGVRALREGKMQLRAVSVLDGLADGRCAWATTYAGLFAHESGNYKLTGLKADQWFSSVVPTEGALSSFKQRGSRQIEYLQHGGGNLPISLPVSIWSMQCLLAQFPVAEMPFAAEAVFSGDGSIDVRITNLANVPVRRGSVHAGAACIPVATFGRVGPGETSQLRVRLPSGGGQTNSDSGAQPDWTGERMGVIAYLSHGCMSRTGAINDYCRRGAIVVCVEFEEAGMPFGIANAKCDTHHVHLARLVVFPKQGS
ncbi:MAG: hypothetical protein HQ546_03180 [Planctomycetes bacterium]|nr:hypothetical protein [Planctomycetota bacterium]